MKNLFQLAAIVAISAFTALPSWAGGWYLDRYEALLNSEGQVHTYAFTSSTTANGTIGDPIGTEKVTPSEKDYIVTGDQDYPFHRSFAAGHSPRVSSQLFYTGRIFQEAPAFNLSAGHTSCTLTVVPVFKWQSDGDDDMPSSEFWIWEEATASVTYTHSPAEAGYSEVNRYQGQNFELGELSNGLEGESQVSRDYPDYDYSPKGFRARDITTRKAPKLMSSGGQTEVYGPSRTLKASAKSSGWNTKQLLTHAYVDTDIRYSAGVARFSLDVNAGSIFQWHDTHPRNKELDAYASKNLMGQSMDATPEAAINSFWDGPASYSTSLSSDLHNIIGNPTYAWESSTNTYTNNHILYGKDMAKWPYNWFNRPGATTPSEEFVWKDTPSKSFHHDLGATTDELEKSSTVNVKITGDNPQKSELTAKAKINWYQEPFTEFTIEVETVAIDLETGAEVNLDSGGEYSTEEAYLAMKEELRGTINAGSEITGTALEVAGSFITPDASDLIFPVAGAAGKRVFKLVRGGARIAAVAGRVTSLLSSNSGKLQAAARARLGKGANHPVIIRIREKTTLTGQKGKLPPNSSRDPLPNQRVTKKTSFLGSFCFVPGTLVDTEKGKRVIESLKAGDLVWAKDESTGEIALKPIAQTFERVAPSTLALTFSNGETIETTVEHPFYVQDKGFTPAGLVALGNSIVTRAGPSLEVVSIEKHSSAHKVYNFEVAEFHTYFVGKGALWTHNIDCDFLESLNTNPSEALSGKTLEEVKDALGAIHEPFLEGVMQRSQSNPGGGWTVRKKLDNGELGDFYLQWHPGGSRHHPEFRDSPYWKFSSGPTGTVRVASKKSVE